MRKALKSMAVAIPMMATFLLGQVTPAHAEDWRKGAEGRSVDCLLQVKGKTYLQGTCVYDADQDGSFRLFGDKYFTYLNAFEDGTAGASWNGTSQASHAQEPLGEGFKRKGGCWSNKTAKICAWNKAEGKLKESKKAPERIKFARGAYSTIVTGKLRDFDSEQNYVIEVGKGQTIAVEQLRDESDGMVSVYLTDPTGGDANDLDLSCHSNAEVSPTLAGDYSIKVVECMKADPWKGSYSLKVTVK